MGDDCRHGRGVWHDFVSSSALRTGSSRCGEDALLASCYRVALDLASANTLASIAFPAISTGIYAFRGDRAARIAVGTVAPGFEFAHFEMAPPDWAPGS